MEAKHFLRTDGSRIDYFDAGDSPDVLIYHHGTPGAGPIGTEVVAAAAATGLRVVELVRPGYGQSARMPGRTVADMVALADELATHVGADRYVTMGWSGGGPHALANAALSARCVAAMTLASVAPYDSNGLDFLAGMGEDNIEEFGLALQGEAAVRPWLEAARESMGDMTGADVIDSLASLLPEADRALLTGERADETAAGFRWAIAHGIDGWLDDDIAFCIPWGFSLGDLNSPVSLWQGDVDLMVPFAHGVWLAEALPNVDAHLREGHGH